MNWIDIVWPLMGGASLCLGLICILVWVRQRDQTALVMFGLAAGVMASLAIFELSLMQETSPERYLRTLRLAHIPITFLPLAFVGFVLLHFRAGRPWLGACACVIRILVLLAGLLAGQSLRFRQVTELTRVEVWGGVSVSAPVGQFNPAMLVATAADAILVVFLADAIASVWKRTSDRFERRRIAFVCGSMILFIVISSTWSTLVATGWLRAPLTIAIPFLGVIIAMAYELGSGVVRVAVLERELKVSESRLRGSEQQLRFTVDAAGIGMWSWDRNGIELQAVDGDHPGTATRTLSEDAFLASVHPDDRAALTRQREHALSGAGAFQCEYRKLQPDGSTRWVLATGRVEHGPNDDAPQLRGVMVDITARRQAEERFRVAVESSPAAMLMVDASGRIALANARTEQVFGYRQNELIDRDIDLLVPVRALQDSRGYMAGVDTVTGERHPSGTRNLLGRRKDGSDVPVEVSFTRTSIEGGSFTLAAITDISERLRLEREVALQREELAHLSRVSLMGEMSGSLAHELNQPLTAVLSNAQAALRFLDRETPDLLEVRDSLVQIVENDKRAGEVIRRLRAMLRKDQVDYQLLQINDVVRDVLRLINSDLLNRRVVTMLDLEHGLPDLRGDRIQLQQVLLNLIINACDAMDGTRNRLLTISTALAGPHVVELRVTDVGRGVPPGDLENIFAPFVTTKSHGMGLGLAVCRTIVQAHEGELWASNNPVEGATLHVRLPAGAAVHAHHAGKQAS